MSRPTDAFRCPKCGSDNYEPTITYVPSRPAFDEWIRVECSVCGYTFRRDTWAGDPPDPGKPE